jgi:hypothetical protein
MTALCLVARVVPDKNKLITTTNTCPHPATFLSQLGRSIPVPDLGADITRHLVGQHGGTSVDILRQIAKKCESTGMG